MAKNAEKETVDTEEIRHFAKDSGQWWDEEGSFAPFHRLNPVRMRYIKDQLCNHYNRDPLALEALDGLNILDVGCGGGLICEPLARLGANVTGVDADKNAVKTASNHAKQSGLHIDYRYMDAFDLDQKFDAVLALEVIEHVADIGAFVRECANLVKPGSLIIFSTLNRTAKSYALGIVAAEYLLRWVPRGTHTWKKFVKPSELAHYARLRNLEACGIKGLIFNPLKNEFSLSETDLDVNYLMSFKSVAQKI